MSLAMTPDHAAVAEVKTPNANALRAILRIEVLTIELTVRGFSHVAVE
jgi:hypothetical protein